MTQFPRNPQVLRVVLLGIDGAGKTTVARTVIQKLHERDIDAQLFRNPGGRRTLDRWASCWSKTAESMLGARMLDRIETVLRVLAVLRSTLQSRRRRGVIIFDRHLQCQLALRQVRGLPCGVVLPWLLSMLPKPDLVVYLSVDPRTAKARITSRNTDRETLEFLSVLDASYRRLPDFGSYEVIEANGSAAETAAAFLAKVEPMLQLLAPKGSTSAGLPLQPLPVREGTEAGQ